MIPIYVISLPDAETRRATISKRLSALGLSFTFFDAVDGRNGGLDFQPYVINPSWDTTPSGTACTASHRSVHQMIVDSGVNRALILEDDAEFSDDFATLLKASNFLDCDIVKFEGAVQSRKIVVGSVGRFSVTVQPYATIGAAAYLIARPAALRFLQLPDLDRPIDLAFNDPRMKLKIYEIEPRAVWQDRNLTPSVRTDATPRLGPFRKICWSLAKYVTVGRVHGARIALRLYAQKFALRG